MQAVIYTKRVDKRYPLVGKYISIGLVTFYWKDTTIVSATID